MASPSLFFFVVALLSDQFYLLHLLTQMLLQWEQQSEKDRDFGHTFRDIATATHVVDLHLAYFVKVNFSFGLYR